MDLRWNLHPEQLCLQLLHLFSSVCGWEALVIWFDESVQTAVSPSFITAQRGQTWNVPVREREIISDHVWQLLNNTGHVFSFFPFPCFLPSHSLRFWSFLSLLFCFLQAEFEELLRLFPILSFRSCYLNYCNFLFQFATTVWLDEGPEDKREELICVSTDGSIQVLFSHPLFFIFLAISGFVKDYSKNIVKYYISNGFLSLTFFINSRIGPSLPWHFPKIALRSRYEPDNSRL